MAGPMPRLPRALAALAARLGPYLPALAASAALGAVCVRAILARAGHPALPLDDSFIHFQFARRLAEGGFFEYVAGEGYSSGATSLLWPLLLAPFHALGLRDLSLAWAAWALGTLAHAAVAVETARLARPLAGRAAAAGAGAMCLAFGAFAWFAWSGMETMALAWILLRTGRLAAGWCDAREAPPRAEPGAPSAHRDPRRALQLALLGAAAPLVRPEGVIAAALAAAALALFPSAGPRPRRLRLLALVPVAGVLLVPALHWALTGEARATTTMVKWLIGNPAYQGPTLRAAILANVRLLLTDIIDGGAWSAVFLPEGARVPILLGLLALPLCALRRRRPAHAAVVAAIALGALLPCTYLSFLWNRLRYVWPFAPAWFVMIACLARVLGDAAARIRRALARRSPQGATAPPVGWIPPLLTGLCAGALATKLPWTVQDLAQSAHAIDRQQVSLGRWAAEHLPADARIGLNDTGALAYFSGRRTFDVVGLTTRGEARHWVAGPGSRFEHYERLPRERLPTHFIVYPQWMACPAVLGRELTAATVLEQSILGGVTMVAYEARWDALGSGAAPARLDPGERILDDIDVADLESEAEHAYDAAGGHDQDNRAAALEAPDPTGGAIVDGGRYNRRAERFGVRAPHPMPAAARLVLRVASSAGATVAVRVGEQELGLLEIPAAAEPQEEPSPWVERSIDLPPGWAAASGRGGLVPVAIELRRGAELHAFHYWLVGRDQGGRLR